MHRQTPANNSFRGYVSGGTRGCVHEVEDNDKHEMQQLKTNFMMGETRKRIEHPQNYGFTSHVRKAEYKDGEAGGGGGGEGGGQEEKEIFEAAEHFTQFMGGNRSFPVCEILDDRRYRLRCLEEGETAMYDDQQQKVHIQRKRIYSRSQFMIESRIIKDDPKKNGHGRDKRAERDQSKDKSIRLSTVVMNKDWIVLERTKEKDGGQQQQQEEQQQQNQRRQRGGEDDEGDPEKKIEQCSQIQMGEKRLALTTFKKGKPHLVFDMDEDTSLITMTSLREDKPHIQFTIDGENGEVSMGSVPTEGMPNLVFEMNDDERKITIATEDAGQQKLVIELDHNREKLTIKTRNGSDNTKIEFDNRQKRITIEAEDRILMRGKDAYIKLDDTMVRIGEENANIPAGMRGSIDTMGNRLIGNLARKVMVV